MYIVCQTNSLRKQRMTHRITLLGNLTFTSNTFRAKRRCFCTVCMYLTNTKQCIRNVSTAISPPSRNEMKRSSHKTSYMPSQPLFTLAFTRTESTEHTSTQQGDEESPVVFAIFEGPPGHICCTPHQTR